MNLMQDPKSGLLLDRKFVDEKQALKKVIDDMVDSAVYANNYRKENYFLTLHMKFDDLGQFKISPPTVSDKLPGFISNTFVFWVSNSRSICELLWMVAPKKRGEKLKVEFNQHGVAYLQAKGAMPQ